MGHNMQNMVEIFVMAFALGMDAFSLAIGLGLNGVSRKKAYQLALFIGWFHVIMTLAGLSLGIVMGGFLPTVARKFSAILLLGLGLHMAYSTLFGKPEQPSAATNTLTGMMLFSIGVSIDALSVGLSLGLRSTTYGLIAAVAFGTIGAVMCLIGIVIGKRANQYAGIYGELVGAAILIWYGLRFLLV